jgi:tetratricopeptide (TPR) repeat protein
MGRHSEAVTLLERNYERSARYYGMSYGETISSCRLLAATYASLGRYEDAVGLLQRVINETRKPEEKPTGDLLAIISDLGGHLQKAGRFAEAIPLQEECLRGFVEIYGLSERWTIDTIDQLGLCFERLGRYNDALGLYQESIDQIRNLEGGDHPAVMEISNFITRLHQMPAEFDEEDDESLVGSDSTETSVEMALTDEQNGDTDDRFATRDVHPGEEDWMGEFFDFDILENALLVRKAQVRTQENET